MLWLYILLSIVLFFAVILFMPIGFHVSYKNELRCLLRIGFVRIKLLPKNPAKNKKSKKKKSEPQKKKKKSLDEKQPGLIEKYGVSWLVDVIKNVAALAAGVLKDFFSHVTIKKLLLSIKVSEEDAAETAVSYGKCCAAVYPSVGALTRLVRCKRCGVDISPDFDEKSKTAVRFELFAKTLVIWILVLIVKHGIKGLKMFERLKETQTD